jgi:hypothetical protein
MYILGLYEISGSGWLDIQPLLLSGTIWFRPEMTAKAPDDFRISVKVWNVVIQLSSSGIYDTQVICLHITGKLKYDTMLSVIYFLIKVMLPHR